MADADPSFVADSARHSMQTIDLSSNHAANRNADTDNETEGTPQATGTYLDQYLEQERQEKAAKSGKANKAAPPHDANDYSNHETPEEVANKEKSTNALGASEANKEGGADAKEASTLKQPLTGAAVVAIPAEVKRELDKTKPRRIGMTYTKEELENGRHHWFDLPDPTFYLGAALLIGCVSLFTWMARFILDYGDLKSKYLWIVTGAAAGVFLLGPFIYYTVSSKHHHIGRRVWDGFCGSFPCAVATFGLVFVYAFGIEIIVNTVHHGSMESQFLIYGTIPLFLLVVLPTFFSMISFQDKISQQAHKEKIAASGGNPNTYDEHPISSSGWVYLGVMLRRVIVGWVCGVCLAAHVTLPAYALTWLAYGLYKLQLEQGIWVIFVIVIPPILIIAILAIIPVTRVVPKALWSICVQWFYYPLMNWDPRKGGFWYRYDNGLTYERLVDHYNSEVSAAEAAYQKRQDGQADAHYANARTIKALLEERTVKHGEVDYDTGVVVGAPGSPAAAPNQNTNNAPDAALAPVEKADDAEMIDDDDDAAAYYR